MKVAFRAVAVSVVVSLVWASAFVPFAAAQQPTAPPPTAPPVETTPVLPAVPPVRVESAPVQPAPPLMVQEEVKPTPEARGTDVWDVGAVAITALGLPFKAAICGVGIAFSTVIFAASFAARPDAAAGILDEGCGTKAHWVVRGEDIRPRPSATKAFEWETHRYRPDR